MKKIEDQSSLLFLDFDGVICDSLDECFVSSWIAYYEKYKSAVPDRIDLEYRRQFDSLRPLIRNGEDYLVIHHALASGQSITDQSEFDHRIESVGDVSMKQFRALMYEVRKGLVEHSRDYWLGLHAMFSWLMPTLAAAAEHPCVYILSTKRKEYILELLDGVPIDRARVLSSNGRPKTEIITEYLDATAADNAVFVDDQIDHLRMVGDKRIRPLLAEWGYVKPEWLLSGEFPVLSQAGAVRLVGGYSSVS